jgi:hypothetical protein
LNSPYLLDSNIFIRAHREYYAPDLAPGFWESLEELAHEGSIKSIDRVQEELLEEEDELADWAENDFSHAFCSTDEDNVINNYHDVVNWVQKKGQYRDGAITDFFDGADGWLIAYSMTEDGTVVTNERHAPGSKSEVKIPTVCQGMGVDCSQKPFEMLRSLDVQL